MEDIIRTFFSEEDIIKRTKDCREYFDVQIPPMASNFDVR